MLRSVISYAGRRRKTEPDSAALPVFHQNAAYGLGGQAMVGGAMSEDIRVSAGTSCGRARFIATCLLHRRALSRIEVALIETERNSEVSVDVGVDEAVRAVRDGHALVVQNRANDILRVGESVRDDR